MQHSSQDVFIFDAVPPGQVLLLDPSPQDLAPTWATGPCGACGVWGSQMVNGSWACCPRKRDGTLFNFLQLIYDILNL